MQLRAFGYGSSLKPLTGAEPSAAGNRVAYSRPGLQEWYANGPLGIEQGFTVAHAPGGARVGSADARDRPLGEHPRGA